MKEMKDLNERFNVRHYWERVLYRKIYKKDQWKIERDIICFGQKIVYILYQKNVKILEVSINLASQKLIQLVLTR